jgi:hypothetical protein
MAKERFGIIGFYIVKERKIRCLLIVEGCFTGLLRQFYQACLNVLNMCLSKAVVFRRTNDRATPEAFIGGMS